MNVVREYGFQCRRRPMLQVVEISARDHCARYIRTAEEGEQLPLQRDQPATAVTVSPELSRSEQQIEMGHRLERMIEPGQSESRFEQWQVERCAVVGHDHLELPEMVSQRQQHRRLFVEIANEVLNHVEIRAGEVANSHKEWAYARAPLN